MATDGGDFAMIANDHVIRLFALIVMQPGVESLKSALQQVVSEIGSGNLHEALVRLWIIAGSRLKSEDGLEGDLVLNYLERNSNPDRRVKYRGHFRELLAQGKAVHLSRVLEEPLALAQALDAFLTEERPRRRIGRVPLEIDGAEYWLVRIPARRREAPLARQANNRASWFENHCVIPARLAFSNTSLEIRIVEADRATEFLLAVLHDRGKLRAYLAHFTDGVSPVLSETVAGKFFATGLSDAGVRMESIRAHLEAARGQNADIVVFPELTIASEQRREIRAWHSRILNEGGQVPVLIVAGSFHEIVGGSKLNRAVMLGAAGDLLTHDKVRPFGEAEGFAENVDSSAHLRLLATAIGLLAMPICKDFNDAAGIDWTAIGPDWCLIPSMGDKTNLSAHATQAERLWKILFRTNCLVANQEFEGDPAPGFVYAGKADPIPVGGGSVEVPL